MWAKRSAFVCESMSVHIVTAVLAHKWYKEPLDCLDVRKKGNHTFLPRKHKADFPVCHPWIV
jgi:hypothetical protein